LVARQSATHRFFIGKAEKLRQRPSLIGLMLTDFIQMVSIGQIPVIMEPNKGSRQFMQFPFSLLA
jgi:hypothetical protein